MKNDKMKRVVLVGCAVGLMAACAQNPGPLFVSTISDPGPGCSAAAGVGTAAESVGKMYVTGGGYNDLPMVVGITGYGRVLPSTLPYPQIGDLDPQTKTFYIDQVSYTYASSPAPPLVGLTAEIVPVLVPVIGDPTSILMPMVGPKAAAALPTLMQKGDQKRLLVTFELRGREGGSGGRITTGPVTFPIEMARTGDCATGTAPVLNTAACYEACLDGMGAPVCFNTAVGPPATDGGCP
jgi:hypothetical protein